MGILTSIAVIILSALIHASFQLSISVFTLLSGHAISTKSSRARLLRLSASFVMGVITMTVLLLSFVTLLLIELWQSATPLVIWAVVCGLSIGMGVAVWTFYYRRMPGTVLWIPAGYNRFLRERIKATKLTPESFSLGLASIISEIIFICVPLTIAGLTIIQLPVPYQLPAIALYVFVSVLPLVFIIARINAGHRLSTIQRWREANKHSMQFLAGSALIVLGFFLYVTEVMAVSVGVSS